MSNELKNYEYKEPDSSYGSIHGKYAEYACKTCGRNVAFHRYCNCTTEDPTGPIMGPTWLSEDELNHFHSLDVVSGAQFLVNRRNK